jgi:Suppressor of fused protein (SUFU)
VTEVLGQVRAHLRNHFGGAEPDAATVTFLGTDPIEVLRFGPSVDGVTHYVSLGCSRHPMSDPTDALADPLRGPRAEVVVGLRNTTQTSGLARSIAVLAATPAVEGVVLTADALIDFGTALWVQRSRPAPFTAVLLGVSEIDDLPLEPPRDPVRFLAAVPITANEAAWVRLKGADALRDTWRQDRVDVLDPLRPAASSGR